jgi:hypothetical protein
MSVKMRGDYEVYRLPECDAVLCRINLLIFWRHPLKKNGSSSFLRNVYKLLPDHRALDPRRPNNIWRLQIVKLAVMYSAATTYDFSRGFVKKVLLLTENIFGVNILIKIYLDISCACNILQVNFRLCAARSAVWNGCTSAIITLQSQNITKCALRKDVNSTRLHLPQSLLSTLVCRWRGGVTNNDTTKWGYNFYSSTDNSSATNCPQNPLTCDIVAC